jgi:hypothetical protein
LNYSNQTGVNTSRHYGVVFHRSLSAAVLLLAASVGLHRASGCGPDFPNWLLSQGDQAVLVAPKGNFAAELARLKLGRPAVRAVPPGEQQICFDQSTEAEVADLRKALKQAKTGAGEVSRICLEHERERVRLSEFIDAVGQWRFSHPDNVDAPAGSEGAGKVCPVRLEVRVVEGLPAEFADYFEGSIAWHNPALKDKHLARLAWERLLARPDAERRYKSTWAAFMLGKSWEEADPEKAAGYFQQVRHLAQRGFRDTLGLAAASLGLEARVCLNRKRYETAIELYLDQMASGDPTATNSLATAADAALTEGAGQLQALVKNPRARSVITAYLISRPHYTELYTPPEPNTAGEVAGQESPAGAWLKAVEEANIKEVDLAEALALAAYRANDMDRAQRWVKRSANSPVAQWLQAKLHLRAGKVQSAAALLARITPLFPITHEGTNAPAPVERKDTLTVGGDDWSSFQVSAGRQVLGELGVLRLARGEYAQALDALLNAGFWMDAAYVADRVLTVDELKGYVDRFWPVVPAGQEAGEREEFSHSEVCPAQLRKDILYLLARRLTRELRGDLAREYYPAEWLTAFDQLAAELRAGWDESQLPEARAGALFRAAMIARTNGMELLGTEVGPDWHIFDGGFDFGVTLENRRQEDPQAVIRPTEEELRRGAAHAPDPDQRFHYRYQAASLAWDAAKLLPDNDDRTAYALWQGGSFLKHRDPECADLFYKALVNRNRKTELGAEADRQRWFPVIDENGYIVPKAPRAVEPEPPAAEQAMDLEMETGE